VVTREPGGTAIAERIRDIIISPQHTEMVDRCELLLYCAARAQHVDELIRPALQRGEIVLCDRFSLSTLAYQGFGRHLSMDTLTRLDEYATQGITPDLTFVFDLSLERIHERLAHAGKRPDRIENQSHETFYSHVRRGYLELAAQHTDTCTVLDATLEQEVLTRTIFDTISARIASRTHT
jgi:dTMP kinase